MIPAYKAQFNDLPEFVGIVAMIEKMRELKNMLRHLLEVGAYRHIRSKDWISIVCPTDIPSETYGYKYVIYDELNAIYSNKDSIGDLLQIKKHIDSLRSEYREAQSLLLRAYGYNTETRLFDVPVKVIDKQEIPSLLFVKRLKNSKIGLRGDVADGFIRGFCEAGFDFRGDKKDIGWNNYLDALYRAIADSSMKYEGTQSGYAVFSSKMPIKYDCYDYYGAENGSVVKVYEYSTKLLRRDYYGRLWFCSHCKSDHSYHEHGIYCLVESIEESDILANGGVIKPRIVYTYSDATCHHVVRIMIFQGYSEGTDSSELLMKLKRNNNIIPDIQIL